MQTKAAGVAATQERKIPHLCPARSNLPPGQRVGSSPNDSGGELRMRYRHLPVYWRRLPEYAA